MATLFDLDNGDLFKWNGEVFLLQDIDCSNQAYVRQYMKYLQSFGMIERFNPYAEVERVWRHNLGRANAPSAYHVGRTNMIVVYVENCTPIACDLEMDFREPDYHRTMDYVEGRIPPRYPVPVVYAPVLYIPIDLK